MLASPLATPELEVTLVGDVPLSWFDASSVNAVIASSVSDRRRAMHSAARAEERRRHPETAPTPRVSGDSRRRLAVRSRPWRSSAHTRAHNSGRHTARCSLGHSRR